MRPECGPRGACHCPDRPLCPQIRVRPACVRGCAFAVDGRCSQHQRPPERPAPLAQLAACPGVQPGGRPLLDGPGRCAQTGRSPHGGAPRPRGSGCRSWRSAPRRRLAWIGEGPARRGRHQDEIANALRVVNRQFLSDHAAQAYPHHVGSPDARAVEHGEDIAGHVSDAERARRKIAASASPVVHQHQPEVPAPGSAALAPSPGGRIPSPGSRQATVAAIAGYHTTRR